MEPLSRSSLTLIAKGSLQFFSGSTVAGSLRRRRSQADVDGALSRALSRRLHLFNVTGYASHPAVALQCA